MNPGSFLTLFLILMAHYYWVHRKMYIMNGTLTALRSVFHTYLCSNKVLYCKFKMLIILNEHCS